MDCTRDPVPDCESCVRENCDLPKIRVFTGKGGEMLTAMSPNHESLDMFLTRTISELEPNKPPKSSGQN